MDSWDQKDIQFYNRPATGYQVILLSSPKLYKSLLPQSETLLQGRKEASPRRLLKPLQERTIYRALWTIIEYQYGSPYSYPAADEADAREQAVEYAMTAIYEHWYRQSASETQTRMDAHIYPFGGLIRAMRLVPRRRWK